MDASRLGKEGFVSDADDRERLIAEALPTEGVPPKDYVLTEPTTMFELRERLDDFEFQVEVLKARLAAISDEAVRLGKSTADWADGSAHRQLGAYPWAKLAGAFAATFVATRILRRLPLGALASATVPLLLQGRQ